MEVEGFFKQQGTGSIIQSNNIENVSHLFLRNKQIQLSLNSWDSGIREEHHGSSLLENSYIPYQYMDSYFSSTGAMIYFTGKVSGSSPGWHSCAMEKRKE
ncbi:Ycf2 protein [Spatholobus suberectus]|nr:Ycf2 protein [Spatholobus suberectus]